MRKRLCVPMMMLCLLAGCGRSGNVQKDWLEPYQKMAGCEMEARVVCDQNGSEWDALLHCSYETEGQCSVEVLEPETIAGIRAVLDSDTWYLEYEEHCLNAGTLSGEGLSPAEILPRVMDALGSGWLLEEHTEERDGIPCRRVLLDQTGSTGGKIETACWLKEEDGLPLWSEVAVDGEIIFQIEFTQFAFCDKIE